MISEHTHRSSTPFDTEHWHEAIKEAHQELHSRYCNPGAEFLPAECGIDTEAIQCFNIGSGYANDKPALLIPWYNQGQLIGGRYHILYQEVDSSIWWPGSGHKGKLYGGHTHQNRDILVLCDSEFDAMNIYQAVGDRVDVLSTPTKLALPPALSPWANHWTRRYCWFTEPRVGQAWATTLRATLLEPGRSATELAQVGELDAFAAEVIPEDRVVAHKIAVALTCASCGEQCSFQLVRHPSQKQRLLYWQCDCCGKNMSFGNRLWENHSVLAANNLDFNALPIGSAYQVG